MLVKGASEVFLFVLCGSHICVYVCVHAYVYTQICMFAFICIYRCILALGTRQFYDYEYMSFMAIYEQIACIYVGVDVRIYVHALSTRIGILNAVTLNAVTLNDRADNIDRTPNSIDNQRWDDILVLDHGDPLGVNYISIVITELNRVSS